jgi:hypothetical protein
MGRGEYIGSNGVSKLPQAEGFYRSYAYVFRERVNELDAAIQQADHDYATKYQTDWRAAGQKPGEGLDQSHFVLTYWVPFVRAWNVARDQVLAQLLAGKISSADRGPALVLMSWASRYNDLKMSAGASWGLETAAPSVVIHGTVDAAQDRSVGTPWWKIAIGATAVLGVGYLMLVRPTIKTGERRLAETRKLASDVGLRSGMTEEERDRAFDTYYKKRGYPSYLLSTAPKVTT